MQANVNPTLPVKEWPLEALANKMKQYCYILDDLTPELLAQEADGDYEQLRDYLRQRGVDAYWQKVLAQIQTFPSLSQVTSFAVPFAQSRDTDRADILRCGKQRHDLQLLCIAVCESLHHLDQQEADRNMC